MRKSGGFTLAELLVVAGIIALLVGLLMPTLVRARVASNRIACRANLAELGRFFQMYLNDSKGRLPRVNTMPSVQPPINTAPSIVEIFEPNIKESTGVWRCRADQIRALTTGAPPGYETYFEREGGSYQYNPILSAMWAGQQINDTHLYQQKKQNQLPIFFDYEPFHGKANTVGAMNYLFADMHVGDLANE